MCLDVDGTLVDNESAVINTWQQTIEELLGKHFEKKELDFVLGIPGVTTMQKLGIENPDKAFELWSRNFQKHRSEIALFEGIDELVNKRADRIKSKRYTNIQKVNLIEKKLGLTE